MQNGEPEEKKLEAYRLRRIEGFPENFVAERFSVDRRTIWNWCKEVSAWRKIEKREEEQSTD